MSCDWNIYCKTCDSIHEFNDANHRRDLMVVLITHASAIAGLYTLLQDNGTWVDIELKCYYGTIDVGWFHTHHTHELFPIDEYRRINGLQET